MYIRNELFHVTNHESLDLVSGYGSSGRLPLRTEIFFLCKFRGSRFYIIHIVGSFCYLGTLVG